MDYPKDWKTRKATIPKPGEPEPLGHQDVGGTICIHSLAVKPEYQDMGIGSVLIRSYIQRIKDAKIADRLALLAHDDMKKFYGRFGFDDMGTSQATFGGGNWSNMVSHCEHVQGHTESRRVIIRTSSTLGEQEERHSNALRSPTSNFSSYALQLCVRSILPLTFPQILEFSDLSDD